MVVGDVTPEHARGAIEKRVRRLDGAPARRPNVFPPRGAAEQAGPSGRPGDRPHPSRDVTLGETLPITYNDPDYPVLQLANTVLTGGFYASLLFHDLRELHGYAYSVDSSFSGGRNRSTFTVNYGADPQNVARAARLVVDDLTSLQKKPLAGRPPDPGQGAGARRAAGAPGVVRRLGRPAARPTPRPAGRSTRTGSTRGPQLAATPERVRAAMAKWIRPAGLRRGVVQGPAGNERA